MMHLWVVYVLIGLCILTLIAALSGHHARIQLITFFTKKQ